MIESVKDRWPLCLALSGMLHAAFIFSAGFVFIRPPEYGIQGSVASIDVYMVAARPEVSKSTAAKRVQKEKVHDLPVMESEMTIFTPKETGDENPSKKTAEVKALKQSDPSKDSAAKGDGSSLVPGRSVTTLFALGSNETAGKQGKYQNPPPQYPEEAQRRGWQGLVLLKALIEKEGKPSKVVLEKSSGHRSLDKSAIDTISDWKFEAGRIGNVSVASWVRIPIRFELD